MPNKKPMPTIVVDTETYFTNTYTLSKLCPVEYVRDPQFKLHGVGIAIDDQPPVWYTLDTIRKTLIEGLDFIDWANSRVVGHNLLFDSLILTENLGLPITHWSDTISLAKSLISVPKHNLDFLSKLLLKDEKTKDESGVSMVNVGKKLVLSPEEDKLMGDYCLQDVNLTRRLYQLLRPFQTDLEERVLSTTINWYAHPILQLDQELLASELLDIQMNKERLIDSSGWSREDLSSNSRFVEKVELDLGLTFPTKISPTTGKPIPASGKGDPEFIQFKDAHPEHDTIWEARTAIKSTLLEARIQTFQRIGALCPKQINSLPVPLIYAGSHTYRWAGVQYNMMNLPNLRTSKLRNCIRAPKDHVIVVADLSQVELRVNMWFCEQMDVHDLLADGKDLYKHYAAQSLNKPEAEVTKTERQLAKVKILGLGYSMGSAKFKHTLATGALGSDPVHITDKEAETAVKEYRTIHSKVVDTWKDLTNILWDMADRELPISKFRCLEVGNEIIKLPDGMILRYPNLKMDEDGNFHYGYAPKIHKIYSGLLAENIVQSLSRSIIAKQIIDIEDAGYHTAMMVHDEVLCVTHKDNADQCLADMLRIMSTTPTWAPGLVLSAEGGFDFTYVK